jgi:hypothetical protein
MKAYWGVEVELHTLFDLGTRWRCVVGFMPQPFYPQRKSPWYLLDRRLGGPQDMVVKRKIPSPCQESNPRTPIIQPVAERYTD